MTYQARHNRLVKNDGEANNRYESANSWWSCFIGRVHVCESGFFMLGIHTLTLHIGVLNQLSPIW